MGIQWGVSGLYHNDMLLLLASLAPLLDASGTHDFHIRKYSTDFFSISLSWAQHCQKKWWKSSPGLGKTNDSSTVRVYKTKNNPQASLFNSHMWHYVYRRNSSFPFIQKTTIYPLISSQITLKPPGPGKAFLLSFYSMNKFHTTQIQLQNIKENDRWLFMLLCVFHVRWQINKEAWYFDESRKCLQKYNNFTRWKYFRLFV